MNISRRLSKFTIVIGLSWLLVSCTSIHSQSDGSQQTSLTVALYEWVPNINAFEEAIIDAWPHTTVPINFVEWDGYSTNPTPDLDVFVFDGVFLSYFAASGYLRPFAPSEINNSDDYLDYALQGSTFNGQYFALPQIGCTNILFYRPGDRGLANISTLTNLWNVMGPATYTVPRPPNGQGLMMDFSGSTTSALTYIAAAEAYYNQYSESPTLPSASNLDPNVMKNLSLMVQMAGPAQAAYSDQTPYQRAAWFDTGTARATVGFTESMSYMQTGYSSIDFKPMPLADNASFDLFYVDVVGVNSNVVGKAKESYAVELANLLASEQVLSQTFAQPSGDAGSAQYLMPVRHSVFNNLMSGFAQYEAMYAMVTSANPQFFRLGTNSRNWLVANKNAIQQQILGMGGVSLDNVALLKMQQRRVGKP